MGLVQTKAMTTITTTNIPRECIMGQWLPGFGALNPGSVYSKLREEFDYLTEDQFDVTEFFQYKGQWYCMDEFMRLNANSPFDNHKWDGYASHTYFSGVLVKYFHDGRVIVGTYSS